MTSAIVFGGNGYLGRHLVHYLMGTGWRVRAFDVQSSAAIGPGEYQQLDVRESLQLESVDWNVDAVFVLAGRSGTLVGFDEYRDFVATNEIGLLAVLDAIRKSGKRPRIVFPSSRLVYRGSERPLTEDAPKEAKTIYAVNKLACEMLLGAYSNAFELAYTVYRLCVPYGNTLGGGYSYGTIGSQLNQARKCSAISLYGDGALRRTFSHIEDVCFQILDTCLDSRTLNGIFNLDGEALSLRETAAAIATKFGATVRFTEWPERDARIESGHTVFDCARLREIRAVPLSHHFGDWVQTVE